MELTVRLKPIGMSIIKNMVNVNYPEVELQREVKLVAKSNQDFNKNAVRDALAILNKHGRKLLKLRSNIKANSYVRNGGYLELNLTIPLDVRYEKRNQDNAEQFNWAWANEFRDKFGVISGGYVSTQASF